MRWQLPGTWLIGSVVTGTVAVLLTRDRGNLPFTPLTMLEGVEIMALVLLGATLFLTLFALGWRTVHATWLPPDPRSVVLWAILVGGVGLVGWGFAAAVTFEAALSLTSQLVLAYSVGGLPFVLVAGMLARPAFVNAGAAVAAAAVLVTGLSLMDRPIQAPVEYLLLLVS